MRQWAQPVMRLPRFLATALLRRTVLSAVAIHIYITVMPHSHGACLRRRMAGDMHCNLIVQGTVPKAVPKSRLRSQMQ